jgi:hypothetical protein
MLNASHWYNFEEKKDLILCFNWKRHQNLSNGIYPRSWWPVLSTDDTHLTWWGQLVDTVYRSRYLCQRLIMIPWIDHCGISLVLSDCINLIRNSVICIVAFILVCRWSLGLWSCWPHWSADCPSSAWSRMTNEDGHDNISHGLFQW